MKRQKYIYIYQYIDEKKHLIEKSAKSKRIAEKHLMIAWNLGYRTYPIIEKIKL